MKKASCAYCGTTTSDMTRDHVIPLALYPESLRGSAQLIVLPACRQCNKSWCNDEPHFRGMLMVAGEPNAPALELWEGKVNRSFRQEDAAIRVRDLLDHLIPVTVNGRERHMVYPAAGPRVTRILRKIIRGLSYKLVAKSPVPDDVVWADALRFPLPHEAISTLRSGAVVPSVFRYQYATLADPLCRSFWILRFYETRVFVGVVCATRAEAALLTATSTEHHRTTIDGPVQSALSLMQVRFGLTSAAREDHRSASLAKWRSERPLIRCAALPRQGASWRARRRARPLLPS